MSVLRHTGIDGTHASILAPAQVASSANGIPIAMCSPFHRGARSSFPKSCGALTLTTILVSKSLPALMSMYVCVTRAKQL